MIKSTFYSISQFKCDHAVDTRFNLNVSRKKMDPEEAMLEAEKVISTLNRCDTISSKPIYEIDEFEFFTCVCNFHHPDMIYFLKLFNQYDKHGTLPCDGSLTDQPNYLMEMLDILQVLKLDKDYADAEKARKQQK